MLNFSKNLKLKSFLWRKFLIFNQSPQKKIRISLRQISRKGSDVTHKISFSKQSIITYGKN